MFSMLIFVDFLHILVILLVIKQWFPETIYEYMDQHFSISLLPAVLFFNTFMLYLYCSSLNGHTKMVSTSVTCGNTGDLGFEINVHV